MAKLPAGVNPDWYKALPCRTIKWSTVIESKPVPGYDPSGQVHGREQSYRLVRMVINDPRDPERGRYVLHICGDAFWSPADVNEGHRLVRTIDRIVQRRARGTFHTEPKDPLVTPLWVSTTDVYPGYEVQAAKPEGKPYEGVVVRSAYTNELLFLWDDREGP